MKGLLILVFGLLFLQSCEKYTLTGLYRSQVLYNAGKERGAASGNTEAQITDTSVYVAAVIVPKEYDWRRDSLYGAVPCELQLLKNGIPQFSMHTGALASSSADTHHLLDGHLYTEYANSEGTVICCDGKELFRYPQREMLKGLLVKGEDVYTLGRLLDGTGFCYRCNGEIVLRQDAGELFGDFSDLAYGRTGALYDSGSGVCFCFKSSSACYSVLNGEMSQVSTSVSSFRVKDMRLYGKSVCYVADYSTATMIFTPLRAYTLPTDVNWQSASLFSRNGELWFVADSPLKAVCRPVMQMGNELAGASFLGEDNFVYEGSSKFYSASCGGGTFTLRDNRGEILYIRDSTCFFGRQNVCCAEDEVYALLNPRERDRRPFVWHGGKKEEYDINGYLTAIEVVFSPPN